MEMKNFVIYTLLLSLCVGLSFSLKLLLVFPLPGRSHYSLGNVLGKILANAGHEVTMTAPFSDKKAPKNYKEIILSSSTLDDVALMNLFELGRASRFYEIMFLNKFGAFLTEKFFEDPKVQELLKSNEHFDVVIVEQFWNEAMKVLAHHFKAPLVLFSALGPNRWINNLVTNPEPLSYVPDILLNFDEKMNIFQRTYNLFFGIFSDIFLYLWCFPKQSAILEKYFPNAPHLEEIQNNISLILLNSHESINYALPHVPNMIDIGGFHVNPPKRLPQDLQKFMDNATNGVIYFSMGSNLNSSHMPDDKKDAILKVLGSRKEKVLWKWDMDSMTNKPDNIFISKWFPQQDVLGHPNCKLFITHGGLLSTTETVYMGIPILAIPIFGDQKLNAARASSLGYGRTLSFSSLNENNLAEAINDMLDNPRYAENVKRRSSLMHDRPIKPAELAIYWVEYIARHKGAPHLRVAGVNLPFYKYYSLDVVAILIMGLVAISCVLSKMFRWGLSKYKVQKVDSKKTRTKKE